MGRLNAPVQDTVAIGKYLVPKLIELGKTFKGETKETDS